MFYKFSDCIILEARRDDTQCYEYRVVSMKQINSKKTNTVLHDECVSVFDSETEELTDAVIKTKNPDLTDKAIKHILELIKDRPMFSDTEIETYEIS